MAQVQKPTANDGMAFALSRLIIAADGAVQAWMAHNGVSPFDMELGALAIAVRETTEPARYRAILAALTNGDGDEAVRLWHEGWKP